VIGLAWEMASLRDGGRFDVQRLTFFHDHQGFVISWRRRDGVPSLGVVESLVMVLLGSFWKDGIVGIMQRVSVVSPF